MIILAGLGVALIVVAPALVRLATRRGGDAVAVTRILQLMGFIMLVAALFIRPYNPDTAAVPPPPDAAEGRVR